MCSYADAGSYRPVQRLEENSCPSCVFWTLHPIKDANDVEGYLEDSEKAKVHEYICTRVASKSTSPGKRPEINNRCEGCQLCREFRAESRLTVVYTRNEIANDFVPWSMLHLNMHLKQCHQNLMRQD